MVIECRYSVRVEIQSGYPIFSFLSYKLILVFVVFKFVLVFVDYHLSLHISDYEAQKYLELSQYDE